MSTTPIDHPDWANPVGAPSATAVLAVATGGGSARLVSPGAGKFLRVWAMSVALINTSATAVGEGSIQDDNGNPLLYVACPAAPAAGVDGAGSGQLFCGGVLLPVGVGLSVVSNGGATTARGTLLYSIVST